MFDISAISTPTMINYAGSIDSLESRIKQIEGMLQSVDKKSVPATGNTSFRSYLTQTSPTANGLHLSSSSISGDLQARTEAFQPMIAEASQRYGVDKDLINAVIRQESGFNPAVTSHAGAQGLMQLMPETARNLGVTNPNDPAQNVDAGVRHLKGLLETYNGNIPLALAAYNAGGGAVKKYGGVPPYQETQQYVRNILAMFLKQKQSES